MEIREIVSGYAVAPQLGPSDMEELAALGYRTVICNRPDGEVPVELQAAAMRDSAEAAGLIFVLNPVETRAAATSAAGLQARAIDENPGPVVAYCASGTRSTIVWALGNPGGLSADEIVGAAARAGYDLEPLRGVLKST